MYIDINTYIVIGIDIFVIVKPEKSELCTIIILRINYIMSYNFHITREERKDKVSIKRYQFLLLQHNIDDIN